LDDLIAYHPRLVTLTGSINDITSVAKKYRVYFSAPEGEDEDYMVDHSLFAYLIGTDGSVVEIFGRDLTAEQLAAKVAASMVQDRLTEKERQILYFFDTALERIVLLSTAVIQTHALILLMTLMFPGNRSAAVVAPEESQA
ncbi:hypothetical protein BVRB_031980, partial [Beta vulgaris subsp. vulgaris]